jgi:hypothetical protein
VGFVKIDVEGHEEAVLDGAQCLEKRSRPVYMIEIEERHNPGSVSRMARRFASRDYDVMFFDGCSMRGIAEFDLQRDQSIGSSRYINNFFFLPKGFKAWRV